MDITMILTDTQSKILDKIATERNTTVGELLKTDSAMNLIRNRVIQESNTQIYADNYPSDIVTKIIGA